MGAVEFFTSARGKDINDAYRNACNKAEEEHGHEQGYSGEINSTHDFYDVTMEFENSRMRKEDFITKKLENCEKGVCYAIKKFDPVANTNKVKTKVENTATPGTKVWELKYSVTDIKGTTIALEEYKADAIKKGREYTEKTGIATGVYMKKVLKEGKPLVAKITYKPSKEKEGKWEFFGVAPY